MHYIFANQDSNQPMSPTTIGTPWLWLSADVSGSLVLTGSGDVGEWLDVNLNSVGITSPSGRRPNYQETGYNGKVGLRFNHNNSNATFEAMNVTGRLLDINTASAFTIAVAAHVQGPDLSVAAADATSNYQAIIGYTGFNGGIVLAGQNGIQCNWWNNTNTTNTNCYQGGPSTASNFNIVARTEGSLQISSVVAAFGSMISNAFTPRRQFTNTATAAQTKKTYTQCFLGASNTPSVSATYALKGEIYEIVVFNRALTNREMTGLSRYLERWR